MKQYAAHYKVLRQLGFKRDYCDRSKVNPTVVQYSHGKPEDDVCIEVQFWSDGGSRVTHWHKGHQDTVPVEFGSIEGMLVAIKFESKRDELGVSKEFTKVFA